MKLIRELNLIFMILQVWSRVFTLKPFLSYKRKSIIGGASFENILESEINPNLIRIRKFDLIFTLIVLDKCIIIHIWSRTIIKDKLKEQKEILKNTIDHVSILGRGNFQEKNVFRCIWGCSLVEMLLYIATPLVVNIYVCFNIPYVYVHSLSLDRK